MKPEEELIQLRAENQALRDQLVQRDELLAQLLQRVQALEERVAPKIATIARCLLLLIASRGKRKHGACASRAGRRLVDNQAMLGQRLR